MSEDNSTITLPPLSEESVLRIEDALFDEIADHRPASAVRPTPVSAHPRRRRWAVGLGIAAAFVGGALVSPPLLSVVSAQSTMPTTDSVGSTVARDNAVEPMVGVPRVADMAVESAGDGHLTVGGDLKETPRDIITTAQLTLRVPRIETAAQELTALAEKHGGYIESSDIGLGAQEPTGELMDSSWDLAQPDDSGWVSIRIPTAHLTAVMNAIGDEGQVLRSSISRHDVTSIALDLRARVDAATASVKRLTELMAKSDSLTDLIKAESALSERQAQLESYQQELKNLDEQVAMSTVQVQLTQRVSVTQADPAGFGDGLLAGWNGLIIAMNAVVVALGFLLPWLVPAAVVVLVVWLIRRRHRTVAVQDPD